MAVGGELGEDRLREVHRDGEPDADRAAALAEDRRVDADRLSATVDQRSAAVAWIDGGVGLDEVVVRAATDDPAGPAHDPGRHRLLEPEGVPDGHDRLTDL